MTEPTVRHWLASVAIDEGSLAPASPEQEHERKVAVADLLKSNSFEPEGGKGGPYALKLGLVEGQRVELVAGDVALVGAGRDVAEDPGAARAGEELQCPLGYLVVVGAEVFQVPAARAGVRVAYLDRPVAQEGVVAVREEGQGVPGVEAGGAGQALLVRGRDLESCRAEGAAHLLVPAVLVRLGLVGPGVGRVSERDAVLRVDHWPLPRFPPEPSRCPPAPGLAVSRSAGPAAVIWPPFDMASRRRFPGTAGRVDQRLPWRLPSRQGRGCGHGPRPGRPGGCCLHWQVRWR